MPWPSICTGSFRIATWWPSTTVAIARVVDDRARRSCSRNSVVILDTLQAGTPPERVVAVGFSLGSAVAAYVARHRPVAGLIMVTPFDSLETLAQDLYWWAPVRLLLRHRMPTIDFVRGSTTPTTLIVAEHDSIVPARRSEPLRTAITNLVLDRPIQAGHNDLYDHPAFAGAVHQALAKIVGSRSQRLNSSGGASNVASGTRSARS